MVKIVVKWTGPAPGEYPHPLHPSEFQQRCPITAVICFLKIVNFKNVYLERNKLEKIQSSIMLFSYAYIPVYFLSGRNKSGVRASTWECLQESGAHEHVLC